MNLTHIEDVLKNLPALDILEVTGLDGDPVVLVESLRDFIEENQESIEAALVTNGLTEEGDE
jgi:hypothetical protein